MNKCIKFLFLILGLSFFTVACANKEALPAKINLEKSMERTIDTKGENHNFLNDDIYIENVENLIAQLSPDISYAIGNLDGDNIPEIVIFNEAFANGGSDETSLNVYSFNGTEYSLLDTVSMGYDHSNYQIKIGNISENQRGLFLSNKIGTNAHLTYGFILENGKLKKILDDEKSFLLAIYPENEIKDINNDGILNFSINTIDPETENSSIENADKMTLWYKWNGKDSVSLVRVEKKDRSKDYSNKNIFTEKLNLIEKASFTSIDFLIKDKDMLSKYDNSILIQEYIQTLNKLIEAKNEEINTLFLKSNKNNIIGSLNNEIIANIDNLNSLEYLNQLNISKDKKDIKTYLVNNLNLALKLNMAAEKYYYSVDYQKILELFKDNILNEYMDYLEILSFKSNEPFMLDGQLVISQERLVKRILFAESFKTIYPYSDLLSEIHDIYLNYLNVYFFGDLHNPTFDFESKVIKEEALEKFKENAKTHSYTGFSYIINNFISWLEENNNIVDDNIREKLYNRLN